MALPAVGPRIKETHCLSGAWVGGRDLFPLCSVTGSARQSQVLKDSSSSFGSGKNVIQVEGIGGPRLWGTAVFTAPASPGDNLAPVGAVAHGKRGSFGQGASEETGFTDGEELSLFNELFQFSILPRG